MKASVFENTIKELKARREDIRPSDVVLFSEPLRSALNHVIRLGRFGLADLAEKLGFTHEQARVIAGLLVERNLIVESGTPNTDETVYETRLSSLTRPLSRLTSDIWKKID